jgi:hypothetical protein
MSLYYQGKYFKLVSFIFTPVGLSLRELLMKFKEKILQILKLVLLGKRVLFFGQKVEKLCAFQYSILSLIPGK